jgi:hypothetical protein
MRVDQIVTTLSESIIRERGQLSEEGVRSFTNPVAYFVLEQSRRMPDYLRFPFKCLTLIFGAWPVLITGRPFHQLPHEQRVRQVRAWRNSRLRLRYDFIKFFDAFVMFALYSERYPDDDRHQMPSVSSNS